jgi:hypothetical protein
MGAKKKAVAAGAAAKAAKDNTYVQKLVEDEDLRDDIRQAYESVRDAYERLGKTKSPAKALLDDKKLQKDLRNAADSIKDATHALREPRKKSGGFLRKVMLVTVAGGLALALSEGLRKKVLDALFGAEEEFEYTATTTAATPNGSAAGSSTESAPAGSTS